MRSIFRERPNAHQSSRKTAHHHHQQQQQHHHHHHGSGMEQPQQRPRQPQHAAAPSHHQPQHHHHSPAPPPQLQQQQQQHHPSNNRRRNMAFLKYGSQDHGDGLTRSASAVHRTREHARQLALQVSNTAASDFGAFGGGGGGGFADFSSAFGGGGNSTTPRSLPAYAPSGLSSMVSTDTSFFDEDPFGPGKQQQQQRQQQQMGVPAISSARSTQTYTGPSPYPRSEAARSDSFTPDWPSSVGSVVSAATAPVTVAQITNAFSPRSMRTMPSNSSMQSNFVHTHQQQQQKPQHQPQHQPQPQHHQQPQWETSAPNSAVARSVEAPEAPKTPDQSLRRTSSANSNSSKPLSTGAAARRKMRTHMRSANLNAATPSSISASSSGEPPTPSAVSTPQSFKRMDSSDTTGRRNRLADHVQHYNVSGKPHISAGSRSVGSASKSVTGSSTTSGSETNLFDSHAEGAGFTFDAFGLDASQLNAQVNKAMNDLAGSHPDFSFFVDQNDDFASGRWDTSPNISRSSTPVQGDDEEGFVDGFRVTKQTLPVYIRNSPSSTDKSSVTSESSDMRSQNTGTNSATQTKDNNQFKDNAAPFQPMPKSRHLMRPSSESAPTPQPLIQQSVRSSSRKTKLTGMPELRPRKEDVQFVDVESDHSAPNIPNIPPFPFAQPPPGGNDHEFRAFTDTGGPGTVNRAYSDTNATPNVEFKAFADESGMRTVNKAYSETHAPADVEFKAFADEAGTVNRAYSEANAPPSGVDFGAFSDTGGMRNENKTYSDTNVPSDVGVGSDTAVNSDFAVQSANAIENIPMEVISTDKKKKKGSEDTATTASSYSMTFEEKKDEDQSPEKTPAELRAQWEKQAMSPRWNPARSPRSPRAALPPALPLTKDRIDDLQMKLGDEISSPERVERQRKIEKIQRDRQRQEALKAEEEEAAKQGILSPPEIPNAPSISFPTNFDNFIPMQNEPVSKSDGGMARVRQSHVNATMDRIHKLEKTPQREVKSDNGSSPEFFKVKLRKTGLSSSQSEESSTNLDPSAPFSLPSNSSSTDHDVPSLKASFPSQEFPAELPNHDFHQGQMPHQEFRPAELSPAASVASVRKLTYRERREAELQQKREEAARKAAQEKAAKPPERDVASLIKRRIAANKRNADNNHNQAVQQQEDPAPFVAEVRSPANKRNADSNHNQAVQQQEDPPAFVAEFRSPEREQDHQPRTLVTKPTDQELYSYAIGAKSEAENDGLVEINELAPVVELDPRAVMMQHLASLRQDPATPVESSRQPPKIDTFIKTSMSTDHSEGGRSMGDEDAKSQKSSTPKATKMMLNAFLAGRGSVSQDAACGSAEKQSSPQNNKGSSGRPALKDDPEFARYFKMLKLGMPLEVVKHAMIRDGLDAAILDGDHNKPAVVGVPLKDDPTYQKYFKMLKIGMPMDAVKHAMLRDGLDCSVMDQDHNLPVQKAKKDDDGEPKEKDSHRRARLHWKTLRKVTSNSLWATLDQDITLENIEIDEDEFQELFQAEKGETAAPKAASAAAARSASVRVIDPKRANNGGIILARLKMSHDDMADAVDRINEQALNAEQIEHIIEYLPSKEERKALEAYMLEGGQDAAEKFDGLCECEKFMVSMMTVKHAKRKVRALLFKLQFESCLDDILNDTLTVEAACDELINSVRVRQLLGIILTFGNRLNTAGNKKRKAGAFTLDSLLKLNQAKAFDKKTTFLHYVILIVQRNNEILLRFKDDLPTVLKADKVFWDQCLTDLDEVESQLENVRKIALYQARQSHGYRLRRRKHREEDDGNESLSDGEISLSLEEEVEALRATPIGIFTLSAIKYVSSLRDKVEETKSKFMRLLEYFGEDEGSMQPHELFSTIASFCRDFEKAKEEVFAKEKRKQRDERKRQAQNGKAGKPPPHTTPDRRQDKPLRASNFQPSISGLWKTADRQQEAAPFPRDARSVDTDPDDRPTSGRARSESYQKMSKHNSDNRTHATDPGPSIPQGYERVPSPVPPPVVTSPSPRQSVLSSPKPTPTQSFPDLQQTDSMPSMPTPTRNGSFSSIRQRARMNRNRFSTGNVANSPGGNQFGRPERSPSPGPARKAVPQPSPGENKLTSPLTSPRAQSAVSRSYRHSMSAADNTPLSPRSNFRHRKRLEMRERMRQGTSVGGPT